MTYLSGFDGCTGLTEITIPESVTEIGFYAFFHCTGLTGELIIPNSVTEIGEGAFNRCSGLTSVTIGNSVTEIGDMAFGYCTGLTEITIPNSVTEIEQWAFLNCLGLTSVTIGSSVTSIIQQAFDGCTGLTSVYSLNPEPPTCGGWVFFNVPTSTCTLYVPEGSKEAYSTADQWQDFMSIVEIDVSPVADILAGGNAEAVGYYTTDGKQVPTLQRGVTIVRYSDGTARKVLLK